MSPRPSRTIAIAAALLAASLLHAAAERPVVFHLDPPLERDVGYAQAVRAGDTLYVSGSVGAGAMPDAMREAYGTIQKTLAAHGLSFSDVVRETVFTTRLDDFIAQRSLRKTFYGATLPAASWVEVRRLYLPEFVVEIEVTAVFPSASAPNPAHAPSSSSP